jgi:hypothetical protein
MAHDFPARRRREEGGAPGGPGTDPLVTSREGRAQRLLPRRATGQANGLQGGNLVFSLLEQERLEVIGP